MTPAHLEGRGRSRCRRSSNLCAEHYPFSPIAVGRPGQAGRRRHPAGAHATTLTLFEDGDESDAVYAIVSGEGHVRIGVINEHSKGMMVAIYRKGEFFGEMGAIDGEPRSAAALVDGRVRLLRIRRGAFLAVLNDTPALGAALSYCLAQRLAPDIHPAARRDIRKLGGSPGAAGCISRASQRPVRPNSAETIGTRMNQGDMADLLGTTTRSIIAILNRWRIRGLVHFDPSRVSPDRSWMSSS